MEVLLCERGGHPNWCAGRMGGPWKYNDSSRVFFFIFQYINTLHIYTFMTPLSTDVFTWTSAASPGPAPSRSEAFRFSSWRKKNCILTTTSNFNKDVIKREEHKRKKEGFHSSPFSRGPWLLVWGKVEGWVCISGFCQSSSFGFHQWTEAIKKE